MNEKMIRDACRSRPARMEAIKTLIEYGVRTSDIVTGLGGGSFADPETVQAEIDEVMAAGISKLPPPEKRYSSFLHLWCVVTADKTLAYNIKLSDEAAMVCNVVLTCTVDLNKLQNRIEGALSAVMSDYQGELTEELMAEAGNGTLSIIVGEVLGRYAGKEKEPPIMSEHELLTLIGEAAWFFAETHFEPPADEKESYVD